MQYFELYDLPISLQIDQTAILKRYYALSKQYHPDQYVMADAATQQYSMRMTTLLHEAKKILSDPQLRLAYILQEKGYIVPDEKYALSADFLMDMMSMNEAIAEAAAMDDEEQMARVTSEIRAYSDQLFARIKKYVEMPELNLDEQGWAELKNYYYSKKYIDRMMDTGTR